MKLNLKKPQFDYAKIGKLFIKIGSQTLAQFALLFTALIAFNILSTHFFYRIDLTQSKNYSLSKGTKDLLGNLSDTVTITTYFSDNVPPEIDPALRDAKDLFAEYVRFGNGNVKLDIKNPSGENFSTEATADGVPQVRYSQFSQDKFEISQGFLGAVISYKDQKEPIEMITDVSNLEYEVSSRIYKLTTVAKPTVGFLTGQGELDLYSEMSTVKATLDSLFTVKAIDLSDGTPIDPNDVRVLVIAGPSQPLSDRDMFEIDQYVMKGGRLIVLADMYNLVLQSPLTATTRETNINNLLSNYGAEIDSSLVLDESYLPIPNGIYQIAYPYWVLAQRENMNTANPALSLLESAVLFWTSPINNVTKSSDQKFTDLIKSSNLAWQKSGDTISVDVGAEVPLDQQQFVLAALIEGKQTSKYMGQDIPKLADGTTDKRTVADTRVDEAEDTKIVVMGDSDLINDQWVRFSEGGAVAFINLVDWLSSSNDLIAIRSKSIQDRPLRELATSEKTTVKVALVALTPLLLIGTGVGYNVWNRKRKSRI